jgi:cytochrome c-type biogenesis protein
MTEVSIALAFAAGLISFVSPCVLALVPVYLAFLGDAAVTDGTGASPGGTAIVSRAAILPQALLFVGGFSAVFVVLGTSIGVLGGPLFRVPEIRQVAGIAVFVLGLLTTGIFGPVLDRFSVGLDPASLPAARSARSLALGAFVAVGWTPCIGPVLGAIFTMGASSGSAPAVFVLLTAYSVGLAIPFLAVALALPRLRPLLDTLRRHHRAVRVAAGVLIMVIGVMIFFNAFGRLAGLFTFVL